MKFAYGLSWRFKVPIFLGCAGLARFSYEKLNQDSQDIKIINRMKKMRLNSDIKVDYDNLSQDSCTKRESYFESIYQNTNYSKLQNKINKLLKIDQTCQADGIVDKIQYDPNFKTDVYVWGNGLIRDGIMDYSNFFPKKISNFSKEGDPVIVSVKFGLYHEAYLDTEGKIHICKKYKLPSKKIKDEDDCLRTITNILQIDGEQITQVEFTKNRIFGLTSNGDVYVWVITINDPILNKEPSIDDMFRGLFQEEPMGIIDSTSYQVKELRNIKSIKTGEDHFLALDSAGAIWAMGSDKYGQCGQFRDGRPSVPPFKEVRIGKPQKVNLQERAVKIASGKRHSFAISEYGRLYGWGYNHQVQLSHGDNLASVSSQRLAIFEPTSITNNIPSLKIVNVDGGEDYSIIVGINEKGIQEAWGTGKNIRSLLNG